MGIKTKSTLIISTLLATTLAAGCILEEPAEDTGPDAGGDVIDDPGIDDPGIDPATDAPHEIGNGFVQPYGIKADGTYLFIALREGTIIRMDKDGVDPTVLAEGYPLNTSGIALDDEFVYFSTYTGNGLHRVPKEGGEVEDLVLNDDRPFGIQVADGYLYWTQFLTGPGGKLRRMQLPDGAPEDVVVGLHDRMGGLLLEDGNYYVTRANVGIERIPVGGTAADLEMVVTDNGYDTFLDSDDTYFYWGNANTGDVVRFAKDGSMTAPESYVSGLGFSTSYGVAVDGEYIYWTNYTTGTISRAGLAFLS
jgi:hypothetical protein